ARSGHPHGRLRFPDIEPLFYLTLRASLLSRPRWLHPVRPHKERRFIPPMNHEGFPARLFVIRPFPDRAEGKRLTSKRGATSHLTTATLFLPLLGVYVGF